MSWRGWVLVLVAVVVDLVVTSCAARRGWAADESDRIDAIMGTHAPGDGGEALPEEIGPLVMGTSPPLAVPSGSREQLTEATPWSDPPRARGTRRSLGRRRQASAVGRDSAGATTR